MPSPYSSCIDLTNFDSEYFRVFQQLNKTYQQSVCQEMCKQNYINKKCNCFSVELLSIVSDNNTVFCGSDSDSADDFECMQEAMFDIRFNELCGDKECPLECMSVDYELVFSQDTFPNQFYYELLKSNRGVSGIGR